MKNRHLHHHMGQAHQITERGGTPLGGGRRTIDIGDQQSLKEEHVHRMSAFRTQCRQTARLGKTCESRSGMARTRTLRRTLLRLIALAMCGHDQWRDKRQRQKYNHERFHNESHRWEWYGNSVTESRRGDSPWRSFCGGSLPKRMPSVYGAL